MLSVWRGCLTTRTLFNTPPYRACSSKSFYRRMLLYSDHVEDAFDSTLKKNSAISIEQHQLEHELKEEERASRLLRRDNENLSVAVPMIDPAKMGIIGREVALTGYDDEDGGDDDEPVVFPFAIRDVVLDKRFLKSQKMLSEPQMILDEEFKSDEDDAKKRPIADILKEKRMEKRRFRGRGSRHREHRQPTGILMEPLGKEEDSKERVLAADQLFRFGRYDSKMPPSRVPCGGCGAILHASDPKMPGFVPLQLFEGKNESELRETICQRCFVLRQHNVALKMNVPPDYYADTLRPLHAKRATVVIVVDLMDFPGSIYPGILDLLGPRKKIILVGNKMDLIPQDSNKYLKQVKRSLKETFLKHCEAGAIKYDPEILSTMLVSARTGYNMEELVTTIFASWRESRSTLGSDVYLVGTTNVGKSSIFNHLLDSDLCKIKAINRVEKAMTSPVPGTTFNLLKFPIMRPDPWRLYQRSTRLDSKKNVYRYLERSRLEMLRETRDRRYALLRDPAERTFVQHEADKCLPLSGTSVFHLTADEEEKGALKRSVKKHKKSLLKHLPVPHRLDPAHPDFADGRWCYDTPGTTSDNQLLDLLTQGEIALITNYLPLKPRSFAFRNGLSLFIGGLARLDLVSGPYQRHPCVVTVICPDKLPINIVRTSDADHFYESTLGEPIQAVPKGGPERLKHFPALDYKDYQIDGLDRFETTCDIVFGCVGWATLALGRPGETCRVRAWTPAGRGLFLRDPPFLPFAVNLKGSRNRRSLSYGDDSEDSMFYPHPLNFTEARDRD